MKSQPEPALSEHGFVWRCWKCSRILMVLEEEPRGAIEVKCKCSARNRMKGRKRRASIGPCAS